MEQKATLSIWLVILIVFLDWMGVGLVYPMFSTMLFSTEGPLFDPNCSCAARGALLGILLAAMPIAQFFSGPLLGALSDQKGRKPVFVLSLCLAIFGYAFCTIGVLATSIVTLIASRLLIGIAAGNSAVVSATVADLSTASNKAKHFGLYSMACGVGFTVGPILGGKLSEISFAIPFIVAGVATFFNLILIILLFKETHHTRKAVPLRLDEGIRNLKKAFKIPGISAIFITIFMFCFAWSFFFEFLPVTWIFDYQLNSNQIGLYFAFGAAVYALSSGWLIRPIVSRFHNGAVLFWALVCQGIVILAIMACPSEGWIWVYLPMVNFLSALVFPTSSTMVSNYAGPDAQGETLGILASVQAAAFAISPLAAGTILGNNPHMPMALGGTFMLLAALLLGLLLRKELFRNQ